MRIQGQGKVKDVGLKALAALIPLGLQAVAETLTASAYGEHAVASNWSSETKTAVEVLAWHNQRGQAENFLKELKQGVGMERRPCGETWANAVWFRLGVLAHNPLIGFRRLACPGAWARHTIATLQWTLVQVAGRIIHHAGQIVLRLVLFRGIRRQRWALTGVT